jgi:hypothetical protein
MCIYETKVGTLFVSLSLLRRNVTLNNLDDCEYKIIFLCAI